MAKFIPRPRRPRDDVAVVQGCMASYRDEFVDEVLQRCNGARFYVGRNHFEPTVELSPAIAQKAVVVDNLFLGGRKALWQRGVVGPAVGARSAVLELNPRILSVWIILAGRRALGRRSLVWGHAWPRSGAESRTLWLRKAMMRLASGVLLYTESDRQAVAKYSGRPTFVAPNSVCSRSSTVPRAGAACNVVQIGRLVEAKRPVLTLQAWSRVVDDVGDGKLVFVGAGPLERELRVRAAELGVSDRVLFEGHVSDPEALSRIFADALITVSAGYAGLSITHGFAHGVPALVADDEPHAPEIALATEQNTVWFTARSEQALAEAIRSVYADADTWRARRPAISDWTLDHYSVESMVAGFLQAAGR
ncbi:MAG: glycosyltransferase [Sporichthyaceae bacterium]